VARRIGADDLSVCIVAKQDDHAGVTMGQRPSPVVRRPRKARGPSGPLPSVERKQWFDIFMKKEKRGRRSQAIPLHICSGRLSKKSFNFSGTRMTMSNGVLRFDGRLTGAIYVLKSVNKVSGTP
jgi:hypothetical protein